MVHIIDNDPREVKLLDPYTDLSEDDKEQESDIQRELEMIERKKQDLISRLKENKRKLLSKQLDPNMKNINSRGRVEVPRSPKRESLPAQENLQHNVPQVTHNQAANNKKANPNEEDIVRKELDVVATTSYFQNKFKNSKTDENRMVTAYQQMMSARTHTFNGSTSLSDNKTIQCDELEPYSNFHIKKRYIPKDEVDKLLHGIKILRLNKLFAKVRPPSFSEPQYSNWVAIGAISSKEDVKLTNAAKPVKYFKFTLTDFRHNLDAYVFGKKPVERYYNLRVGDIIAVLNPEILPWRPSGCVNGIKSFNLRIGHDFNCILEIGASRDLGWCQMVNHGQSKICNSPINTKTDRCCEFHRELQMRSTASKRIELSGSYALGAPTKVGTQPSIYKDNNKSRNTNPAKHKMFSITGHGSKKEQEKEKHEIEAHHFSNKRAAKAFFDDSFQDPSLLANLESKRRKIKASKMDRNLLKALNGEDASQSKNKQQVKEITEKTLQTGVIQRLGFDPSGGQIAKVLDKSRGTKTDDPTISKKMGLINDLIHFKKDKIKLKPSREIQLEKRHRREAIWKKHFQDTNDSDSDLEIV
ncbi:hypothetical protein B1J92_H06589g [Nakaseomyces glabratus]|nr:hypothetical protein B1J91_H06589g [Nakaseomyces glabratus]OXB48252.1 hypothetical protein B1J92_H06589g [Nakaseomyces glabratus]